MDPDFKLPKIFVEVTEKIFILHAECDQGPSTTAVRISGSSLANPFASISAGIASLWGPQHGGATEECLKMFEEIGSVENIPEFLRICKEDKSARLYGFGHRVFKNQDPRAKVLKNVLLDFHKRIGQEPSKLF